MLSMLNVNRDQPKLSLRNDINVRPATYHCRISFTIRTVTS